MDQHTGEERIQTVCLVILSIIGVAFALWWLRPVMVPFVLALGFAFALKPLIDVQIARFRWPRNLAIATSLLLALVLLIVLGTLVSFSIVQINNNSEQYRDQVREFATYLKAQLPDSILGIKVADAMPRLQQTLTDSTETLLIGTTSAIGNVLTQGAVVTIFVIFLLIGGGAISGATTGTWAQVESQVRQYILTKIFISALTGVLVGGVLLLLGIELWLVIGFFAFLLNFIPNIGSVIATLLPIPIVVLAPDLSLAARVMAIGIPAAIQFTVGNFVEPKLFGESFDLHPVTVLMALIFWGMLWGIVGMLLAVPMTSVMKILFARIEVTAPLAEIMAGRLGRTG